jgi:antitoxin (DNA-binding transcriptional repressor) of toxin-antitoxin stability system
VDTVTIDIVQLLVRVEAGKEIVLARGKIPIAKIVPYQPVAPYRRFGVPRGVVSVALNFSSICRTMNFPCGSSRFWTCCPTRMPSSGGSREM